MELLWWHWLVLGMVLIGIEMLTPTFFLIWFGLGALLVGAVVAMARLSFAVQVLGWAVASLLMTWVWMRYFRNPDRTHAGQAKEGVLFYTQQKMTMTRWLAGGEDTFVDPVWKPGKQ